MHGEAKGRAYLPTIREHQNKLNSLGDTQIAVDGKLGPETEGAWKKLKGSER